MPGAQHVFLFRHCVRSTYRDIDLYDHNAGEASRYPTDLADYLAVPLPSWHAGEGQCTHAGLDAIKGTGKYLLREYLAKKYHYPTMTTSTDGMIIDQQEKPYLHVDFRADIMSQRDVDSAWAMQQGMASVISPNDDDYNDDDDDDDWNGNDAQQLPFILQGLGTIQNDDEFFHPTQINGFSKSGEQEQEAPICSIPPDTPASIAAKNEMLQSRLDSIEMPGNLNEVMDLIEHFGGGRGSVAGPLRFIQPRLEINRNLSKMSGVIMAVSRIGELAYMARASGYAFFAGAKVSDIFNLLAWHDWRRAVTDIGTRDAAIKGAVKVNRILNLLEGQQQQEENGDNNNEANQQHHRATILVGHDDDFAAVATALGLTWMLPEPYRSGGKSGGSGDYSAIPPGAALHFYYNPNDSADEVQISILAPVMISPPPPPRHDEYDHEHPQYFETLNITGILEERPVKLSPSFAQVIQDGFFTGFAGGPPPLGQQEQPSSSSNINKTGIDHLRDRLVNILSAYPEAVDCLKNVTQKQRQEQHVNDNVVTSAGWSLSSSSASSSSPPTYLPVGAAASVTLALSILFMGVLVGIFGTKRLKMGVKQQQQQWLTATTRTTTHDYQGRPTSQTEMTSIITSCGSEP